MASASFVLASWVPAYSSGLRAGISRWSWSRDVMRCLSCQRQLFHSASGTSDQKPRPAGLKVLRELSSLHEGGSSALDIEISFIVRELYFRSPTCQAAAGKKRAREPGDRGAGLRSGAIRQAAGIAADGNWALRFTGATGGAPARNIIRPGEFI